MDRIQTYPTIKPSDAVAWTECVRRVWLENKGSTTEAKTENDFEKLIQDKGLEHEQKILETLQEKYQVHEATSFENTKMLMNDGEEMSYYLDDSYNPENGEDVWVFPITDHEILDGVVGDFEFSENVSIEEKEKLSPLIVESGVQVIEEMGWEFEDTEVWFFGELQITKL